MSIPNLQAAVGNGRSTRPGPQTRATPSVQPARAERPTPPASAGEASQAAATAAPDAPPRETYLGGVTEADLVAEIRRLDEQRHAAFEESKRIRGELEPQIREMRRRIDIAGSHAAATQRRVCAQQGRLQTEIQRLRQKGK
jgi:hypothetical protein